MNCPELFTEEELNSMSKSELQPYYCRRYDFFCKDKDCKYRDEKWI